ncbi:MAG: class IV adenylate cyclase [Candidatus Paceibacterota bacterium]|jgi:adenylate cyclase class 2
MREIEIKLRVKNINQIEEELARQGCTLSSPIRQHDIVYSLKGSRNEFERSQEGDNIIRIRRQDDKTELTLKQQRSNESDNLEYESEVKNPDAVHQMLLLLNWYPMTEVKKTRRKGKLGVYEICLDRVEELGDFVEIENLVDENADPELVRQELFAVAASFGLSPADEETRGYDTQIFQLHHGKNG